MMILYLITNNINGKQYVGMTGSELKRRWISHIYRVRTRTSNAPLHHAIRKHGENNFTIKKIGAARSRSVLCRMEKIAIRNYSSLAPRGYNVSDGGDGGNTFGGRKHSVATRKQMSKTRLAKLRSGEIVDKKWRHTEESKELMSRVQKGHPTSQQTKDKIAASLRKYYKGRPGTFTGLKHSESSKRKISKSKKGK